MKDPLSCANAEPSDDELLAALMLVLRRLMRPEKSPSPGPDPSSQPWLSPADAAKYASISEDTLRLWISRGQLPAGRVGKVIRVKRSDIDALLTGKKAEASGAELSKSLSVGPADEPVSVTSHSILSSLATGRRARRT